VFVFDSLAQNLGKLWPIEARGPPTPSAAGPSWCTHLGKSQTREEMLGGNGAQLNQAGVLHLRGAENRVNVLNPR